MKQLLRILTFHSVKELFRYKSFLFLIFFLILADRVIRRFVETPDKAFIQPYGDTLGQQAAYFVFNQLPEKLIEWLLAPHILTIAAGLFLFKQVISLWPSSDMRRMHRNERGRFGIMEALAALRWYQVVWDALAVALVCGVTMVWMVLVYLAGWWLWSLTRSPATVFITAILVLFVFPLTMAGFSYSSKLAVIRHGTFRHRFRLFLDLFLRWRLFWISWLFFLGRILVEALFVAVIPTSAIVLIDNYLLRMAVAALSATPVYAYLKMASFKFFLEAYRDYELVRLEYHRYYKTLSMSTRH